MGLLHNVKLTSASGHSSRFDDPHAVCAIYIHLWTEGSKLLQHDLTAVHICFTELNLHSITESCSSDKGNV